MHKSEPEMYRKLTWKYTLICAKHTVWDIQFFDTLKYFLYIWGVILKIFFIFAEAADLFEISKPENVRISYHYQNKLRSHVNSSTFYNLEFHSKFHEGKLGSVKS